MKKTLAMALAATMLFCAPAFAEIKEFKEFRGDFIKYSTNTLVFTDFWTFNYEFSFNNNTLEVRIEQKTPKNYSVDNIPNFYFEDKSFSYTTTNDNVPKEGYFTSIRNGEHYFTKEYDEVNVIDNLDGTYTASPSYNYGYFFPEFVLRYNLSRNEDNPFVKDLVTSMVREPQLFHLKIKAAPAKYGYASKDIVDYEFFIPPDIIKEWQELAQFDESTLEYYFSEDSSNNTHNRKPTLSIKDFIK